MGKIKGWKKVGVDLYVLEKNPKTFTLIQSSDDEYRVFITGRKNLYGFNTKDAARKAQIRFIRRYPNG